MNQATTNKWQSVKAGNREVFSEQDLDELLAHFSPQDTEESTLFYRGFVTILNPQQVGTKDQYLGFIKKPRG